MYGIPNSSRKAGPVYRTNDDGAPQESVDLGRTIHHPDWTNSLDLILDGVRASSIVAITGAPGVGKTTMLQELAAILKQGGKPVVVMRPGAELPPLPVIVLIDDADGLSVSERDNILRRPTSCVLAGRPTLAVHLGRGEDRLRVVDVPPVCPDQVPEFLQSALQRLGGQNMTVWPSAIDHLMNVADRRPGSLYSTIRLANFMARMQRSRFIELNHVTAAIRLYESGHLPVGSRVELAALARARRFGSSKRRIALLAMLCAGILTVPNTFNHRTGDTASLAQPNTARVEPRLDAGTSVSGTGRHEESVVQLPSAQPIHVVLLHPVGSSRLRLVATRLAMALGQRGYDVSVTGTLEKRAANSVRYYFIDDEASASAIAAVVGASSAPGWMPSGAPPSLQRPGTVEFMVQDTRLPTLAGWQH